jgi:hypothetical protein
MGVSTALKLVLVKIETKLLTFWNCWDSLDISVNLCREILNMLRLLVDIKRWVLRPIKTLDILAVFLALRNIKTLFQNCLSSLRTKTNMSRLSVEAFSTCWYQISGLGLDSVETSMLTNVAKTTLQSYTKNLCHT